ncbi:MAG: TetR/AcrR family transcriptional regulator [Hahellaceae bacterium]|nr:TetR/AcrR family transcriptional regulator [Hahellaceae bacterium]MCP5170500.1 TetR/AcrR family transcriptional regulator [Hahellaceae bacterium]
MAYRDTEKTRSKREEIRTRILQATHELVVSGGFRNTTIQAVSEQAGIATGTVYKHFPSKAELFSEVFRRATQKEVDKVAQAIVGQENVLLRLQRAIRCFAHRAIQSRGLAWALIAEPVDPVVDADRLEFRQAYAALFSDLIREGIAKQEIPLQSASVTSAAIVGSLAEALVGPLAPPPPTLQTNDRTLPSQQTEDALIDNIIRFCLQAVTGCAFIEDQHK